MLKTKIKIVFHGQIAFNGPRVKCFVIPYKSKTFSICVNYNSGSFLKIIVIINL